MWEIKAGLVCVGAFMSTSELSFVWQLHQNLRLLSSRSFGFCCFGMFGTKAFSVFLKQGPENKKTPPPPHPSL